MKLYAHLLIAAFALSARAATIPEKALPADLKEESAKDPIEIKQELPEQTIKDTDNNLRINSIEDIPVKVVVEDVPVLSTSDDDNEISSEQLKKIREEVKDPGTPQRQEHETQNTEHHVETLTLKQAIQDTQSLLRQGLEGVGERINNFVTHNEQISTIQGSIQALQKVFTERIQELNANIVQFLNPGDVEVHEDGQESPNKEVLQTLKSRLDNLESNFNEEIKKLERGVETIATAKEDGDNSETSSTTAAPGNNINQIFSNFQAQISNAFQNILSGLNPSPDNVQSDSEDTSASRPPWLPNFQNPLNFLNFGQNNQSENQQQTGPVAQFLGMINNLRPGAQSTTQKPAEGSEDSSTNEDNKDPEKKPESPASEPQKKPEESQKNPGPIRQMLERNPIIQGISGAVQRLQQNINNPEKPREPQKKPAEKAEPEKVEEPLKVEPVKVDPVKDETVKQETENTEEEKGLFAGHETHSHHSGPGDSIDSSSGIKTEETIKESSPETVKDEPVPAPEKTE